MPTSAVGQSSPVRLEAIAIRLEAIAIHAQDLSISNNTRAAPEMHFSDFSDFRQMRRE